MDVFEKLVKDGGPIGQHMDRAHGYFAFPKLDGELGPRMQFRGKDMIVWSLNNYLGLVNHPEVRKADIEAAEKYGMWLAECHSQEPDRGFGRSLSQRRIP